MNIAHRDLKQENILMDQDGYLKLIDYGLAKKFDSDFLTMSMVGTLNYMAPEVLNREGHNMTVDWWAVGCLIFEMMFGIVPFHSRNESKHMLNIQKGDLMFPDRQRYGIPFSAECEDIIR